MKVTSTIEKCIFVSMTKKKELTVMATHFSFTKADIFCRATLFLFFSGKCVTSFLNESTIEEHNIQKKKRINTCVNSQ
jgi:hypothetical protein